MWVCSVFSLCVYNILLANFKPDYLASTRRPAAGKSRGLSQTLCEGSRSGCRVWMVLRSRLWFKGAGSTCVCLRMKGSARIPLVNCQSGQNPILICATELFSEKPLAMGKANVGRRASFRSLLNAF